MCKTSKQSFKTNGDLDRVGDAVNYLANVINQEFVLNDKEADIVIEYAFKGLHKVLERRRKILMNKQLIHQYREI